MEQSLTYYITLFVIKIKGIKKNFSKAPIDYKKVRKEDVHQPKGTFFKQNQLRSFTISGSSITEVGLNKESDKLLIFVHGGAFISGPAQHHWDAVKNIAKRSDYKIWMCNYPKAPEHTISTISDNIDLIYKRALNEFDARKISLLGDSVGGTLVSGLIQRLIKIEMGLPKQIILISPVMDASMSNPDIDQLDSIDPMLSKAGVLSAKKMCAENGDLKNEMISPLYGSFECFPTTTIFIAENDITCPDQKLAILKLKAANINFTCIEGKNMPHIWPLLPVMKEAKAGFDTIIKTLND